MRTWRYSLGAAGLLLGLFGVFRIVTEVSFGKLLVVGLWLVGAVVVHDGILTPLVLAVGTLLTRVPPRARRYVQGGLVVAGLITVIALPLITLRGTQPPQKSILRADYGAHLTLLIGLVAAGTLLLYAVHVARDVRARTPTGDGEGA